MKRTDIKAGVVYATKSSYGAPAPIVFLEDGAAGLYVRGNYGRGPYRKLAEDKNTKAKGASGYSDSGRGYAAIKISAGGDLNYAEAAERMSTIDPVVELARFLASERPSAEGLGFDIVTSLSQIGGLYAEEKAAYDSMKAAEQEAGQRRREADRAASVRRWNIVDALNALGIGARGNSAGKIELSLDEAEKLLTLLAAKTED
jgi:hypothetical protein